ncbi:hypothetical protein PHJA_002967000 [Phtheirospermum japonicum]|uniref:Uncharacterized protein n=1 Tax=Phtheirospermum japonicum TaxID=374723 RepID=A0A830DAJ4_9LAMI|nr:hypothetical protein PHJA_002967000 [Phtheirospermum japonicum]
MSFLAGRLASTEGSYFLQESKQAVTRLARTQKNNRKLAENNELSPNSSSSSSPADVLPEVLRHSLPPKIFNSEDFSSSSSFSSASKWALERESVSRVSPHAINPLSAYVSLPQVSFGAKRMKLRWQLPNSENSVLASTANDLRQDKHVPINPEKLKAAAAGLTQIGSAFAVATALVFGGSALIFGLVASKLQLKNTDDIRNKGEDLVRPKFEVFKEQLAPLRTWAEKVSKERRLEREESMKENPLIKELSRKLGAKTST